MFFWVLLCLTGRFLDPYLSRRWQNRILLCTQLSFFFIILSSPSLSHQPLPNSSLSYFHDFFCLVLICLWPCYIYLMLLMCDWAVGYLSESWWLPSGYTAEDCDSTSTCNHWRQLLRAEGRVLRVPSPIIVGCWWVTLYKSVSPPL